MVRIFFQARDSGERLKRGIMGVDAEMFVRTRTKVTEANLREWHYAFGSAFHDHLWAFGTHDNKVPETLYLFPVEVWEQDGDDIIPEEGETFLRLRPTSRYYGPGYERGDFPTLKAMAEFLEVLIPESEIWYGGDSSGMCAERFDRQAREEMLLHFVQHQHAPYLGHRNQYMETQPTWPKCPYCQRECPQFGFGKSYASFSCLGCGWKHVERDGKTETGWNLEKQFA